MARPRAILAHIALLALYMLINFAITSIVFQVALAILLVDLLRDE